MRRALVALVWLAGGCTIFNAPDESKIRSVPCVSQFECLLDVELERDPPCEPLLTSFTLNDSFQALSSDRWETLSAPQIRDEGLELFSAGIRSRAEINIGASIPFQLVFPGSIIDRVRREDEGCNFSVSFDVARNLQQSVLRIDASYRRLAAASRFAPAELKVKCTYRTVPIEPTSGAVLTRLADQPFELSVIRDPTTRELLVQIDGREICRTPMAELEAPVRLRLSSEDPEYAACGLRVESLDLITRAQEPPDECEGLRRPLIPDDQCIAGPLGTVRPWEGRVVRTRDRHEMLMSADAPKPFGGLSTRLLVRATSSDGRRDWSLAIDPVFVSTFDLLQTGAFYFDEPRDRLLFWFTDFGPPIGKDADMDGMDDDWERAHQLDPTRDDSAEDIDMDGISNGLEFLAEGQVERGRMIASVGAGSSYAGTSGVLQLGPAFMPRIVRAPLAVAPHPRGMIGYFGGLASDDSEAIFAGFSRDGQSWQLLDAPVLSRTTATEWDGRGVRSPAVFFTGDFYLMAYAASEFLDDAAIGLALSKDGIEWVRYANNPVVIGDDSGFDSEGVEPRSIELNGDAIRIWYFARTNTPNPCLRPRADYKQIGLTELRAR